MTSETTIDPTREVIQKELSDQTYAMLSYALSNGLGVEPNLVNSLISDECDPALLASAHKTLSLLISPAKPNTVTLFAQTRNNKHALYFLGAVPLLRELWLLSLLFLIFLVATGASNLVTAESINRGFLDSAGENLYANQLFLMACAGLGACFAALFQASNYVSNSTYDPKYDSTYWARILLGVIAGIIIVEMLPRELFSSGEDHDTPISSFGKPTLALLAGFSANLVYQILLRLVAMVETLVKGDATAIMEAKNDVLTSKRLELKADLQKQVAKKILEFDKEIADADPRIREKLNALAKEFLD